MKYFFILGTNPTLSIAEISLISNEATSGELLPEGIFVFEKDGLDAKNLIKTMGGTVKIGVITGEVKKGTEKIKKAVLEMLDLENIKGDKKYNFGVSNYGKIKINEKVFGMEIKKHLKKKEVSSRWVTSREKTLSSVVAEQNGLINNGAEIVLFKKENKILIGKTLAVQPFKELSFRDYGRPARDDRSGMLPPKLAQIMLNLSRHPEPAFAGEGSRGKQKETGFFANAQNDEYIILDPFCGSGTILTEAMLMGYKNLIGADISKKAITDTQKNIEWTKKHFRFSILDFKLFNKSATELSKFIKPNSIDTIVTEPYLGPQRGKIDFQKTVKELEKLYSKVLAEFYKILKPEGRVVMIWPVFLIAPFNKGGLRRILNPALNNFKIINPISESLRSNKTIQLTDRNTIIYGREGQRVWREIVVLGK